MVDVAQLVRALDCGSRGRRFETDLPPFFSLCIFYKGFFYTKNRLSSTPKRFLNQKTKQVQHIVNSQYIVSKN